MLDELRRELEALASLGKIQPIAVASRARDGLIEYRGKRCVNFTSWDYLNINADPRFRRAVQKAVEEFGFGSTAARGSTGTGVAHVACERRIASFFGAESALLFSSRNQAVWSLVTAVASEHDLILCDELIQSPFADAAYLVGASVATFSAFDESSISEAVQRASGFRRAFVVVEGVSPTTGAAADIALISAHCAKAGAQLIVDESAAIGALGLRGAGARESGAALAPVAAIVADFGLGAGCYGACVAGPAPVVSYVAMRSRAVATEISPPPAVAAAISAALDRVEIAAGPRETLSVLSARLRTGLAMAGVLGVTQSKTPVIALPFPKLSQASDAAAALRDRGFLGDVHSRSTVRDETAYLRLIVNTSHTERHIDDILDGLSQILARIE